MEAAFELDGAAAQLADTGHVLYPLRNFVPGRIELVGWRVAWGFDRFKACDERIQSNYFAMAMQDIDRQLSWNERWDGGDVNVCCLFAHHLDGFVMRLQVRFG